LVGHSEIIDCLNKGAAERWNKEPGHVPIRFSGARLKQSAAAEYEFEEIAPKHEALV
jgi:hypothetical protein